MLLPDVEDGVVILIGATTQNPFFAINSPLLSRSQIFTFEPLTPRAHQDARSSGRWPTRNAASATSPVNLHRDALAFLAEMSRRRRPAGADGAGDRRQVARPTEPVEFTLEVAQDSIQRKALDYDPTGDTHYDLASAFIKSMRGSDPDAAIYWLARMLEAGEDPRFIARRLVIFASRGRRQRRPAGAARGDRRVATRSSSSACRSAS